MPGHPEFNELSSGDQLFESELLSSELQLSDSELSSSSIPSVPQPLLSTVMPQSSSLSVGSSSFLEKAAIRVGTNSNSVVDPNTILTWITVIGEVLKMCPRNASQIKQAGREQRLLQRRQLMKSLERHFPRISRNEALERARHMFEVAASATVEEIQSALDEVRD